MIYEPVTEFGKKIASLLKYDDGVRLEIHDYLEEIEPRIMVWKTVAEEIGNIKDPVVISKDKLDQLKEKDELWDKYIETTTLQDVISMTNKLKAIKKYNQELKNTHPNSFRLIKDITHELDYLLSNSEFTTDCEEVE